MINHSYPLDLDLLLFYPSGFGIWRRRAALGAALEALVVFLNNRHRNAADGTDGTGLGQEASAPAT
jgi:hypothetical protein